MAVEIIESLVLLILGKWYLWGWCTQRPFWVLVAFHTLKDCVVWECMISIWVISFVSTSKITKELSRLWILHTSVPFISSLSSMPSTSRQPWLMKSYNPASSLARSFSEKPHTGLVTTGLLWLMKRITGNVEGWFVVDNWEKPYLQK